MLGRDARVPAGSSANLPSALLEAEVFLHLHTFNLCRTRLATTSSAHCSKYLELECLNPHFVTSFLHDLVQSVVCLFYSFIYAKGR